MVFFQILNHFSEYFKSVWTLQNLDLIRNYKLQNLSPTHALPPFHHAKKVYHIQTITNTLSYETVFHCIKFIILFNVFLTNTIIANIMPNYIKKNPEAPITSIFLNRGLSVDLHDSL